MDIKPYLLELIAIQKTVGINALGTLYKKRIPGRYDSETHSFLPPKYEIAFTSEVNNDTALATFISEKKNISIESANYYVNELVEEIQSQLADHHYADFSPFGELKRIDNEIVFEPSKEIDFSFNFYGLPSVSATLEENQVLTQEPTTNLETPELEPNEETQEQEATDEQPVYDEIADVNSIQEQEERIDIEPDSKENLTEQSPLVTDPLWKPSVIHRYEEDEEEDDDENSRRWMPKFLKTVLTLIIIVAIAGALIYYFYPDLFYTIKGNFSNPPVESEPVLNIDSGKSSKIDSPIIDSLKTALVLPSVIKDSLTTKTPDKTIFYEVIGSAMKTQKKADEIIASLSKRGINAKKVDVMPGRRIKISLGSFTDFGLAKKFQDSLRIKLKNPEIYIQIIKPKN